MKKINKRPLESHRKYRNDNREKIRKYQRKWVRNNPEKRKKVQKRYNASLKGIYFILKWCCKRRGVKFDWKREDFIKWYKSQKKVCFYCGVKEKDYVKNKKHKNRLEFDRLVPSLGYKSGNVVLCCSRCNIIKSDFFTKDEMLEIADKFIKPKL